MVRYSKCASVDNIWKDQGIKKGTYYGITVGAAGLAALSAVLIIIEGIIIAITSCPWCCTAIVVEAVALVLACMVGIWMVNRFRDYFFDHKLLCIGDGSPTTLVCGMVTSIEENGDGDNSLNLLVDPTTEDTTIDDFINKDVFANARKLIKADPRENPRERKDLDKLGFIFNENLAREPIGKEKIPLLHCEIQGTALDDYCKETIGYLTALCIWGGLVGVVGIICHIPVWGWIAIVIIGILLALLNIFKGKSGYERVKKGVLGEKSSTDLASALPEAFGGFSTPGGYTINIGDHVAVLGLHVCDTGHYDDKDTPGCWNEIHPISGITKLPAAVGRNPQAINPRDNTPPPPPVPGTYHNCNDYFKAIMDFVSAYRGPSVIRSESIPLEHDSIG
jgi:hypothetical protein